jgi:hypothetical protein
MRPEPAPAPVPAPRVSEDERARGATEADEVIVNQPSNEFGLSFGYFLSGGGSASATPSASHPGVRLQPRDARRWAQPRLAGTGCGSKPRPTQRSVDAGATVPMIAADNKDKLARIGSGVSNPAVAANSANSAVTEASFRRSRGIRLHAGQQIPH